MDLRDFSWPLATVLAFLIVAVAMNSLFTIHRETQLRIACIEAGGTVGRNLGQPLCDLP